MFRPSTPQSAYTTPRASLAPDGITRVWRRVRSALLKAAAALVLIPATSQAQVCNTAAGGLVYVDACCFKVQPSSGYRWCQGSYEQVTITASFLGAEPQGFLENQTVTWIWQRQQGNDWVDSGPAGEGVDAEMNVVLGDPAYAGNYRCHFNEGYNTDHPTILPCGDKYSSSCSITVIPAPGTISIQQVSQEICPGTNFELDVSGPAPDAVTTYQWYKNGAPISNSNTQQLFFNNVAESDEAAYYCVLQRTGTCPVTRTSNTMNLTVLPGPPVVTNVPNQSVFSTCPGTPITLGPVVATGLDVTYQWYVTIGTTTIQLSDGFPLANQTEFSGTATGTLSISSASSNAAGTYFCTVANTCRTLRAYECSLTVIPGLQFDNSYFGIDPSTNDHNYCQSYPVTDGIYIRSLADSSTQGTVYYRWFKRNGNNWDYLFNSTTAFSWADISGASTPNLRLRNYTAAASGDYRCTASTDPNFSATCGTATGRILTLSVVNSTPHIISRPDDQKVCVGGDAVFSAQATLNPTYAWYGPNGTQLQDGLQANGTTVVGAHTGTLQLLGIHQSDLGSYTCAAPNSCGATEVFSPATLSTFAGPTIVSQPPATMTGCIDGTTFLTVNATGEGLSYQWRRNGNNLSESSTYVNVNSPTLQVNIGSSFATANFTCRVTGVCSNVTTTATNLSRSSPIIITSQPVATTGCANTEAVFSVAVTGTNPTYQWRRNGIALADSAAISGSTTPTLTISPIAEADAGNYRCDITNACGTISTDTVPLDVTTPYIITNPVSTSTCTGGTFSFTVVAEGPNLTYEWRNGNQNLVTNGVKANGTIVSGATTNTITFTNAQDADIANFHHARVINSCGTTSSLAAGITFNPAPAITVNPTPRTLCAGGNVALSAAATGLNVSYKWQKDSVDLSDGGQYSGTSTPNLTITNAQAGDTGSYRCGVTSNCGSVVVVYTTAALVTVNPLVAISAQPGDQFVCPNSSAVFSVAATGGTLTYQWQKGTVNLANGGNISGATTATLSVSPATSTDAGLYRCVITNNCGSLTSAQANLTINVPVITTQPPATNGCAGGSASITVAASGANLTYQWKKGATVLANSGRVSGATSPTLTISGLVAADAGNYTCVVTSPCGSVTSSAAALGVNTPLVITVQPVPLNLCQNGTGFLQVAATGGGLTYRWQRDGVNLNDDGQISGSRAALLTISAGGFSGNLNGSYRCVVTNACGSVTSNSAAVAVYLPVAINTQPLSTTLCESTGSATIFVSTSNATTFQWQKNGVDIADGNGITGTTTAGLVFNPITASQTGVYRCRASNGCNSLNTSNATVTVNSPPSVTVQPLTQTGCNGGNTTLSITATGTSLTYRWQKNGVFLSDGAHYSGTLTPALTIIGVTAADADRYRCRVTGVCEPSPVFSSYANLAVSDTPPQITLQPVAAGICQGADATFSVTATSADTYLWKKNGSPLADGPGISGAATATLTLIAVDPGDVASYSCAITNGCGTSTSDAAPLTISTDTLPVITGQPQSASSCDPASATFSITATSADAMTYQWQWFPSGAAGWANLVEGDNSNIGVPVLNATGVTTAGLTVSPLAGDAANASLRCIVSNLCGPVTSDPADFSTAFCCPADFNQDGGIDGADVDSFFAAWETGDPTADVNQDGGVDGSDVDYFFSVWQAGGCN